MKKNTILGFLIIMSLVLRLPAFGSVSNESDYNFLQEVTSVERLVTGWQDIVYSGSEIGTTEFLIVSFSHGNPPDDQMIHIYNHEVQGGGWIKAVTAGNDDKSCEIWARVVTSENINDLGQIETDGAGGIHIGVLVYDGVAVVTDASAKTQTSTTTIAINNNGNAPFLVCAASDNGTSPSGNEMEYFAPGDDIVMIYLTNDQSFSDGAAGDLRGAIASLALADGGAQNTGGLQAEDASYNGPVFANNQVGYNGTGFLDYVNASNDYIEWTVNAPASGSYDLSFRYALPNGGRPLQLKVNGTEKIASFDFPATGTWTNWSTVSTTQTLNAGNNTIRLTAIGFSGGNIDELVVDQVEIPVTGVSLSPASATLNVNATQQLTATVQPANATNQSVSWSSSNTSVATVNSSGLVTAVSAGSATITVTTQDGNKTATCAVTVNASSTTHTQQAENASFNGPTVETNQPDYNGTGFLDYQNSTGDYIEWTVNLPSAGNYDLTFRYANGANNRPLQLKVNGTEVIPSMDFLTTGSFAIWGTTKTTQALNAGNNTIRLTAIGSSGGNFDELTVEPEAINYWDDCDALTGWNSGLSLNTSNNQQGTGCIEFSGTNTPEFYKSFSTAYNSGATVTNGVLKFWYYISDVSKTTGVGQVEIGSDGQPDSYEYNWSYPNNLQSGQWNEVVLNLSEAGTTGGTPNLSAINWFRIYVGKNQAVTTRVDGIQLYADPNKSGQVATTVNENAKGQVAVYPNPLNQDVLTIALSGFEQLDNVEVSITNLMGQVVYSEPVKNKNQLEINTTGLLNNSVYFVVVKSGKTTVTKKLVVQ